MKTLLASFLSSMFAVAPAIAQGPTPPGPGWTYGYPSTWQGMDKEHWFKVADRRKHLVTVRKLIYKYQTKEWSERSVTAINCNAMQWKLVGDTSSWSLFSPGTQGMLLYDFACSGY